MTDPKATVPQNKAVDQVKQKALSADPLVSLVDWVRKSTSELARVLPSHIRPDRMARIAETVIKTTPKLAKCDPRSFMAALFQCASVGLEPIMGQAYLIPYWNGKDQRFYAQLQIGYQGWQELFYRHPRAESIMAEKIHKADVDNGRFLWDPGRGELSHTPDIFSENRGPVIGYYAIAHLKGNERAYIKVMTVAEVVAHAKRYSKCYDRKAGKFMTDTPWGDELAFHEMAKKTVLKKLLKDMPKSIEIQNTPIERAIQVDETAKADVVLDSEGKVDMLMAPNVVDYAEQDSGTEGDTGQSAGVPNGKSANGLPASESPIPVDPRPAVNMPTPFKKGDA